MQTGVLNKMGRSKKSRVYFIKNKSLFLIKIIDRPSFLNIYLYMLRSNRSVTNIEYIYIYICIK
jgi:hypothetical protein